jgi:hypothetical protein
MILYQFNGIYFRVTGEYENDNELTDKTYVELNGAVIRIAWHFSTASGPRVKDFWLFSQDANKAKYEESLKAMESAPETEINDLRFI